jgi:hypothetical protein
VDEEFSRIRSFTIADLRGPQVGRQEGGVGHLRDPGAADATRRLAGKGGASRLRDPGLNDPGARRLAAARGDGQAGPAGG